MRLSMSILCVLLVTMSIGLWGQAQIIGQFPTINGGFEDQTGALNVGPSSVWSIAAAGTGTAVISNTGGRSGPHYVTFIGNPDKNMYPPTMTYPMTGYRIQFYYQGDLDGTLGGDLQSVVEDHVTSGTYSATITNPNTGTTWTKRTFSIPTGVTSSLVYLRALQTGQFKIDDFVVYQGAIDTTPPSAPTNIIVGAPTATSLNVSWTAPVSGVDGGGYLVIRYAAIPTGQPNPLVNGVYAVGNAIGTGTVAYLGTATSFVDSGLNPFTQYWYRVYTADKAFNYSPMLVSGGDETTPVELSSFTALITVQNFVKLNWTTQSETNVSGFYIYRNTANDLETAMKFQNMISATNTSLESHYSYIDQEVLPNNTYYYWLQNLDMNGEFEFHGPVSVIVTEGGEQITPPEIFVQPIILHNAYPNPFTPSTDIPYTIKNAGTVKIEIFNSKGQLVWSQTKTETKGGYNHVVWTGKDQNGIPVTSGIYTYRMTSGTFTASKKVVLVK